MQSVITAIAEHEGSDLKGFDGSDDNVNTQVELEHVDKQRRRDVLLHDVPSIVHRYVFAWILQPSKRMHTRAIAH